MSIQNKIFQEQHENTKQDIELTQAQINELNQTQFSSPKPEASLLSFQDQVLVHDKKKIPASIKAPPNLLTVTQFSERHSAFSQSSLRSIIFNAESRKSSQGEIPGNGFSEAIIRIGRKVLIDETKFFECVTNIQH